MTDDHPTPPAPALGPDAPPDRVAAPHRSRAVRWIAIVVLLIAAAIGGVFFLRSHEGQTRTSPPPPVPVVAVAARRGDIDVFVTGLGTVTPLNTVEVKTRVDGQLMKVAYNEGQRVQKDAPLIEIDPRPYQVQLEQAQAQLARDQATLQNAQVDLERYQTLITKNAVAQQVLETQRATVSQDEGTVKADQASIDSARLNIAYCHIAAPLTGRVGLRLVDPGNMVSAAAAMPLVVITQTQPISVIFTIPEQQLPAVRTATSGGAHPRFDAFDREWQEVLATGELTTIDNEIDQPTGTLKLRATVPNRDESLFPNQFVNARLLVQRKRNVTLVPNGAIQRNGTNTFVYLITPAQLITVRPVKVGTTENDQSEIVSGLAPDEVVVTQGVDKLQEGTRVVIEQPADENVKQEPLNGAPVARSSRAGVRGSSPHQ